MCLLDFVAANQLNNIFMGKLIQSNNLRCDISEIITHACIFELFNSHILSIIFSFVYFSLCATTNCLKLSISLFKLLLRNFFKQCFSQSRLSQISHLEILLCYKLILSLYFLSCFLILFYR